MLLAYPVIFVARCPNASVCLLQSKSYQHVLARPVFLRFGEPDSRCIYFPFGDPGTMLANSIGKGKTIVELFSPAMKFSEER